MQVEGTFSMVFQQALKSGCKLFAKKCVAIIVAVSSYGNLARDLEVAFVIVMHERVDWGRKLACGESAFPVILTGLFIVPS